MTALKESEIYHIDPSVMHLFPQRKLGTQALIGAECMPSDSATLPEGFRFAEASSIEPVEVVRLKRTTRDGSTTTLATWLDTVGQYEDTGHTWIEIGVRDEVNNRLAGYGTLIDQHDGHGILGDFTVHPLYQGRGIGKAIIDQRIAQADKLGLHTIALNSITPENSLTSYYLQRGFAIEGGVLTRRRPW